MIWLIEDTKDKRQLLDESSGIQTIIDNEVMVVHNSSRGNEASCVVEGRVDTIGTRANGEVVGG
jgi:hypothetical protein